MYDELIEEPDALLRWNKKMIKEEKKMKMNKQTMGRQSQRIASCEGRRELLQWSIDCS